MLNAENAITRDYAASCPGRVVWFNAGGPVAEGFWMRSGELFADGAAVHERIRDSASRPPQRRERAGRGGLRPRGRRVAGVDPPRRLSFPGVEHRIEFVRTIGGVSYYNDSKATNVDATMKALDSFDGGLWVILGGKDKKSDYTAAASRCSRPGAGRVLLIGAAAEKIAAQLAGSRAPLSAAAISPPPSPWPRAEAQTGDTVLLAPACASFDQFTGYEHRGRVFKELVSQL